MGVERVYLCHDDFPFSPCDCPSPFLRCVRRVGKEVEVSIRTNADSLFNSSDDIDPPDLYEKRPEFKGPQYLYLS